MLRFCILKMADKEVIDNDSLFLCCKNFTQILQKDSSELYMDFLQ